MKKTTVSNKETTKKKYIVEVEAPKEGEKVSTGGVRRNGKLTAQFKNPVPYEEKKSVPTPITKINDSASINFAPTYTVKERMKDEVKNFAADAVNDLMRTLWHRGVMPYIETKIVQTVDKLVGTPNNTIRNSVNSTTPDIIDIEVKEVTVIEETSNDKIINFPKKDVG